MNRSIPTLSLFALGTSLAQAGTLGTPVQITNDADSGVDNSLTYTHTLDLGNGGGTTINGVSFPAGLGDGGGAGYLDGINGWFTTTPSTHGGNPNTGGVTGDINNLLTDMRYGPVGSPASLRFTGLTPGTTYTSRIYYRQWGAGNREHDLTFSEDGGNSLVSVATIDQDATNTANYIDYTYTAQASPAGGAYPLEVLFTQTPSNPGNASWHLYGASNHVAAGVHETPQHRGVVTSDNHYTIYLGGADGSNMRAVGRDDLGDWKQAEGHAMDYQPGDHIYIAAWDNPGATGDPQMVVGNFDLPGGGILGTNAIDWEAVEGPAGLNPGNTLDPSDIFSAGDVGSFVNSATFGPVGAAMANTSGPWGGNPIFAAAFAGTPGEFVWLDTFDNVSITNTNESVALFRTMNPILPIPEPSPLLLCAAAGLMFARRRR